MAKFTSKQQQNVIIVLFGIGLVIRFIFSSVIHPLNNYLYSDMQTYLLTAVRISKHLTSPLNILYPPGYSLFLLYLSKISQDHFYQIVAFVQSLFGMISCLLLFDIARKIISNRLAIIFLFLLTVYYPWIDFTGYLLSENLATLFLVLISWITYKIISSNKDNYYLLILPPVTALASLVRANLLLSGLFCLILAVVIKKAYLNIDRLLLLLTSIIVSILFMLNINYSLSKKVTISSLNGGLVFAQGQCRYLSVSDSANWSFGPPVYVQRGFTKEKSFDQPFTNSDYFYQHGLDCLKKDPSLIVQKVTDIYYLFLGNVSWPSSNQPGFDLAMKYSHYLFALFVIPGLFLGLSVYLPSSLTEKRTIAILYVLILSLFATSIIYYTDIRYRSPYDGVFILLALWGYSASTKQYLTRPRGRNK